MRKARTPIIVVRAFTLFFSDIFIIVVSFCAILVSFGVLLVNFGHLLVSLSVILVNWRKYKK
ncbi:hypothetical protein OCO53_12440 [Peribacillus frigoritolerans]|nr:hypothetical protein [Peribacillus frigoritolerans]